MDLRKLEVWHGNYRDILFEIKKWEPILANQASWAYYIYAWDFQFPEEYRDKLKPRVYYTSYGTRIESEPIDSPLAKIEFHGGCTFYQVDKRTDTHFANFRRQQWK